MMNAVCKSASGPEVAALSLSLGHSELSHLWGNEGLASGRGWPLVQMIKSIRAGHQGGIGAACGKSFASTFSNGFQEKVQRINLHFSGTKKRVTWL